MALSGSNHCSDAILSVAGTCLALLACSGPGAGSSLDASVHAPVDGSTPVSTFQVGYGPDPAPKSCTADGSLSVQCGTPDAVCIDAGVGVTYALAGCSSGSCAWGKVDYRCDLFAEGGICIAGSDAALPGIADGRLWVMGFPCAFPVDVPAVPVVLCDVDAGDAGDGAAPACPPPPSACAGGSILYYDDGVCVSGQCQWAPKLETCPTAHCSNGACVYLGTSAPSVPN